jgi:diadenosine tetraphosphate (Ap4A) HIT family hydrolase
MAWALAYHHGLDTCPFCSIDRHRIWIESEYAIALPDTFTVTEGHTLVVPRKHVGSIYELSGLEQMAIWELVADVRQRLLTRSHPDGFNIGLNAGVAAGQTIPRMPMCTSSPDATAMSQTREEAFAG